MALALILVASSLSTGGYFLTKKSIGPVVELVEELLYETDTSNKKLLDKKAEEVIKKWQESEKILTIILKHGTTLLIDEKMKILKNCIESDDVETLFEECFEIHASLNALLESERPSIRNIL